MIFSGELSSSSIVIVNKLSLAVRSTVCQKPSLRRYPETRQNRIIFTVLYGVGSAKLLDLRAPFSPLLKKQSSKCHYENYGHNPQSYLQRSVISCFQAALE